MNIIKLSATESTNDYLKELSKSKRLENFTIVTTENQLKGRGQSGSKWSSEPEKNLTFSILINNFDGLKNIFDLNIISVLSVLKSLKKYLKINIYAKWPNDILAVNKKICGILIENSFNGNNISNSVIGIGLNVNQINFETLPKATSMADILKKNTDKWEVFRDILANFEEYYSKIKNEQTRQLWTEYHQNLFKLKVVSTLETETGSRFSGIIEEVDSDGNLVVKTAEKTVKRYKNKEIKILY